MFYYLFNSHQSIDLAAGFNWNSIRAMEMDLACRSLFLEQRVINTPTLTCPGQLQMPVVTELRIGMSCDVSSGWSSLCLTLKALSKIKLVMGSWRNAEYLSTRVKGYSTHFRSTHVRSLISEWVSLWIIYTQYIITLLFCNGSLLLINLSNDRVLQVFVLRKDNCHCTVSCENAFYYGQFLRKLGVSDIRLVYLSGAD
jgi:hypothetical protein